MGMIPLINLNVHVVNFFLAYFDLFKRHDKVLVFFLDKNIFYMFHALCPNTVTTQCIYTAACQ